MKTCWSEIKHQVKAVNPEFYALLDEVNPSDDLGLTIAEYAYGQPTSDSENFYLPDKNGISRKPLDQANPLGLVLDKCIELFNAAGNSAPWWVFMPGDIIGLMREAEITTPYMFSPGNIYGATAGSRNAFILNLYSNNDAYQKLKKYYQLPDNINPENPLDHYKIFREIAQKEKSDWRFRVLNFDDKWRKNIQNNLAWLKIKNYIYKKALIANGCFIYSFHLNHAMRDIARKFNFRHKEYSEDMIKQIFYTALGQFPGFMIARDERALPMDLLTKSFNANYSLYNLPIMMHTAYAKKQDTESVFLSISQNTLTTYDMKTFRPLLYLSEIKEYLPQYIEAFKVHALTKNSVYGQMYEQLKVKYYSEKGNSKQDILKATALEDDPLIKKVCQFYQVKTTQTFPERAPFLKAFIEINFEENIKFNAPLKK